MHELSLAASVLDIVEDQARREGFSRVQELHLEMSGFSGIDADALRFALECIAHGTLLEAARLRLDISAGHAWCLSCCRQVALMGHGMPCPACGSYQLRPTDEPVLRVVDMMVSDD